MTKHATVTTEAYFKTMNLMPSSTYAVYNIKIVCRYELVVPEIKQRVQPNTKY